MFVELREVGKGELRTITNNEIHEYKVLKLKIK